jgi:hypothetical protein
LIREIVRAIGGAVVPFFVLRAVAEGLYLWLDIEDNTRRAAEAAERRAPFGSASSRQ